MCGAKIMRTAIFSGFLLAELLLGLQSASAQASRNSYYIALYNYFSYIPAFPIAIPQNEQPGDVYSQPGIIYARKNDCFGQINVDSSETYFARSVVVDSSNVAAEIAGERAKIAQVTAEAGVQLANTVNVSYGENGKAKWSQLTEKNLRLVLERSTNANECRDRLLRLLRSVPDNLSSIPWIIQSVWYATVNFTYQTISEVDAKTKAEIERGLLPLGASGSVRTDQHSNLLMIANTGRVAFPVAWRPAFISLEHYEYIKQLMDKEDWFRFLLNKIGTARSDQEILEILLRDFKLDPKRIPRPKDIISDMSHGAPIPFQSESESHLAYVKGVNALTALAKAYYGDRT